MFMYGFINRFCFFKSIRKFLGRMAACDNSFRRNFLSSYKWYLRSKSLFHGLVFEAITEWKMSKYGVIPGPHFPAFGMNAGKYGPEITPYLDTFQEGEQILWIQQGLPTPWTQDINWTYKRPSEDVLNFFWTSYVDSIYILCQSGDWASRV